MNTTNNNNNSQAPIAVRIGAGKEIHLSTYSKMAFCKGGRVHYTRIYSNDLNHITCAKCLKTAKALGLIA
jgi:hypothetical protein